MVFVQIDRLIFTVYAVGNTDNEAFLNFEENVKYDLQQANFSIAACQTIRDIKNPFIYIDAFRAIDQKLFKGYLSVQVAKNQVAKNNERTYIRVKFEI